MAQAWQVFAQALRASSSRAHRRGRACRAAVAGPPPCSPETGRSGHVERRRTHTASRERHSRDDDRAHPGHQCDSATDYGRAPGAHLGAYARTGRGCASAYDGRLWLWAATRHGDRESHKLRPWTSSARHGDRDLHTKLSQFVSHFSSG